jgi:hypothetical protein
MFDLNRQFLFLWVRNAAYMGKERTECKILVGKTEGNRLLGRAGRWWKDNIKTEHK